MAKARTHAIVLFFISFIIYNANFRFVASGDTVPSSLIPIVLLTHGNIVMDGFHQYYLNSSVRPYFFCETRFGYLPYYPLATGVLLTPLYAIPVYWFQTYHPTIEDWATFSRIGEKISASLIAAFSVGLFYLLACRLGATLGLSLILSLAYAFASQSWSTSSQGLWQHGPGTLMILTASLLALGQVRNPTTKKAIFFGLACGIAVAVRPTNMLFALPLYGWTVMKRPGHFAGYTVPMAMVGLALVSYNHIAFGDLRGTYTQPFRTPLWEGLKGLLFSPGRGLFTYFPLTFFGLMGFFYSRREGVKSSSFYSVLMAFVVMKVLLISKWYGWGGGHCFGPRLLTEIQPILLILSIPFLSRPGNKYIKWAVFSILFLWCLGIQFVGAFLYPAGNWNTSPRNVDRDPSRLWDWKDNPVSRDIMTVVNRYRFKPEPLPLQEWKADYRVFPKRIFLASGETKKVWVLVTNTGGEPWTNVGDSKGERVVSLSYHIEKQNDPSIRFDGNRVGFGRVVWPGQTILLSLPIQASTAHGEYVVEISLVQEGIAWFDGKGVMPAKIDMIVKGE